MENEIRPEKRKSLFDQIFFESENLKITRRKVKEALCRIKAWFNRELSQSEQLPTEFKDLEVQSHCDKARDVWQRHI